MVIFTVNLDLCISYKDRLLVSNVTASGCKLSWGKSKNTGGLPLEYLIEKFCVASDSWSKQAVTSNTNFTVNDLGKYCQHTQCSPTKKKYDQPNFVEEGKEYEFRVFAENEIGESEPLTTARPILAKNQYCKYQ